MQKENFIKRSLGTIKDIPLDTKKEIAKIGMTASLGTLVVTSFNLRTKTSKTLHVLSGATLVGFSLWHHFLYQPEEKSKKKIRVKISK
ncbi:MAG: hypothetical protein CR967_02660 [Proteobacteria bacterium]|nr:MAG: hypothetical protein CR967_02660 [Pseudomonadota bacterium]